MINYERAQDVHGARVALGLLPPVRRSRSFGHPLPPETPPRPQNIPMPSFLLRMPGGAGTEDGMMQVITAAAVAAADTAAAQPPAAVAAHPWAQAAAAAAQPEPTAAAQPPAAVAAHPWAQAAAAAAQPEPTASSSPGAAVAVTDPAAVAVACMGRMGRMWRRGPSPDARRSMTGSAYAAWVACTAADVVAANMASAHHADADAESAAAPAASAPAAAVADSSAAAAVTDSSAAAVAAAEHPTAYDLHLARPDVGNIGVSYANFGARAANPRIDDLLRRNPGQIMQIMRMPGERWFS